MLLAIFACTIAATFIPSKLSACSGVIFPSSTCTVSFA